MKVKVCRIFLYTDESFLHVELREGVEAFDTLSKPNALYIFFHNTPSKIQVLTYEVGICIDLSN
jgi:hypothetical protein